MLLLSTTRAGRSVSLHLVKGCSGRATQANPALSFRLDRPGYRPFHFTAGPTSPSVLPSVPTQGRLKQRFTSSRALRRAFSSLPPTKPDDEGIPQKKPDEPEELLESPYTLPNALTIARIIACPFLGYQIVQGDYVTATTLLFACGVSDWLDGYLARHWGGKSVLGSILDPAADKTLMTTLVVTLAWAGLLPVPLAALILGRDVGLSLWAVYIRYTSLPPPRTFGRYFNPTIQSAEVKPTQISKINTALQLVLMGVTTVSPLITYPIGVPLEMLQYVVAGTTIWSGLSYVRQAGFRIIPRRGGKAQ